MKANVNLFFVARGMGELPSGPTGAGGNDGGFSRRPGRFNEERPHHHHNHGQQGATGGPVTIDQSRLPTCPPYTAFIGNLPFDIAEGDVRTFFQMRNIAAGAILNVKLPRDNVENKSRGFGYVEFATCDDLTRALLASNQFSIRNRVVRVDLSDSKPQSERELRPAEANRNWREGSGVAPVARGSGMRGSQMAAEARPVSVADSSCNWRDGAKPVEKTATLHVPVNEKVRKSMPPPPRSADPIVKNWRDSAKAVENKPQALAEQEKKSVPSVAVPAAPVRAGTSKVPEGSWRRG